MLKLLKKALQTGDVTVHYPVHPVEVAPGFRGKPIYDFASCVACSACATACPSGAISMDWSLERGVAAWSINYGRCIFCGRCEEVCPAGAIGLSAEFEMAATKKEDLTCCAEMHLRQCGSCGAYFAPAREVEYVMERLEQAGLPGNASGGWRQPLNLCPRCRRHKEAAIAAGAYGRASRVLGGEQ